MKATIPPIKNSPPADMITVGEVTLSITLPKSEILDFYRKAKEYAANDYASTWKLTPEFKALVSGSWDLESILKKQFSKPCAKGIPSVKGILIGIRKRMENEPCAQITVRITGELWARIQTVASHYGITPQDHCRSCFGYYAALSRRNAKKHPAHKDALARAAESGAQIIPFMPHRAKCGWSIPALA